MPRAEEEEEEEFAMATKRLKSNKSASALRVVSRLNSFSSIYKTQKKRKAKTK